PVGPSLGALRFLEPAQMTADVEQQIREARAGGAHRPRETLLRREHGFAQLALGVLAAAAKDDRRRQGDAKPRHQLREREVATELLAGLELRGIDLAALVHAP